MSQRAKKKKICRNNMKIYGKRLQLWVGEEASKGLIGDLFSLHETPLYQDIPLEGADHSAAVGAGGRLARHAIKIFCTLLTFTSIA